MSKSPAMLNRANKIAEKKLKCIFRNLEYTTFLPVKPQISVKKFLQTFAENNLKGDYKYYDLEIYKNKDEFVNYENFIDSDFFENKYTIYNSELTPESIMNRMGVKGKKYYKILGVSEIGDIQNRKNNFFTFLVDEVPNFKVSNDVSEQFLNIKNVFNNESLMQQIEENKKGYSNPWLYNTHSFSNLSLVNLKEWDEIFYKNMLVQMFNFVNSFNKDLILDVDTTIKGLDTREKHVDILIKNKDNTIMMPLNLVDNINEMNIYDRTRKEIYDYYFPKLFPLFMYEFVNPNNPDDLKSDILKMLETVNKEGANKFRKIFRKYFFREFEFQSFKNFDSLKILSKNRYGMARRIHVGVSTYNDKFRFNLYCRPHQRKLDTIISVQRSQLFDFNIDFKEMKIKNGKEFNEFLNIFNTLISLSPVDLDSLYMQFISKSNLVSESEKMLNEALDQQEVADQKRIEKQIERRKLRVKKQYNFEKSKI